MAARQKVVQPGLDIPEADVPFKPSPVRFSFQKASILRGPELFIREDHTMPVIHLGFFYPGGKLIETKTNAGITSLMLRSMLRDSKTRTADQIYRQLEIYGGLLTPVMEDDYYGFHFSILSPHVEKGLDLLAEMIRTPKLDPEEVARQKAVQLLALRTQSGSDPAFRRLRGLLFADHSYARDPNGTEESLANITAEAVQAWHRLNILDRKPIVVIIGDTQGTGLAGYFVRNFSGSRFEDLKLPEGYPKPVEKGVATEASWPARLSSVMMGFQAPPYGDEEFYPLMVLQSHASGFAGRLTGSIMDRMPAAQDVVLLYEPGLRGGSITVSMSVALSEEEQALKILTGELQRLSGETISYRDYRSAVNSAVGMMQVQHQERNREIEDVVRHILGGAGIEGFQDFSARLQGVRQNELQETAQRIFKTEKSAVLRIHGKSTP